jgi:hypothetical protein
MVNVNDNDVQDGLNQSDLQDEGTTQPPDTVQADTVQADTVQADAVQADAVQTDAVQTSPSDELSTQPPLTDKSADSSQESGDSMENVMNLYEESFKRFAEGEVVIDRQGPCPCRYRVQIRGTNSDQ